MYRTMRNMRTKKPGDALLVSVLILGTILLGFAIAASTASLQERQNVSALRNKKTAEVSANACMEQAINTTVKRFLWIFTFSAFGKARQISASEHVEGHRHNP